MKPVITLDGPAGVGKSTLANALASRYGFAVLASGSIYRLIGRHALQQGLLNSPDRLVEYARSLQGSNWLELAAELGDALTTSEISAAASQIASHPGLRSALLALQHECASSPGVNGLVAEGRDMGTVVFPQAPCKFFITASSKVRATRRCLQQGLEASAERVARIAAEIAERDQRDANREVAPLKPAVDALVINTSDHDIQTTLAQLFARIKTCMGL